jgi:hypothetical protein
MLENAFTVWEVLVRNWNKSSFYNIAVFLWIIIPSTWTRLPGSVVVKYSRNIFMGDVLLFVNYAELRGSAWVLRKTGLCTLGQRMDSVTITLLQTSLVYFLYLLVRCNRVLIILVVMSCFLSVFLQFFAL